MKAKTIKAVLRKKHNHFLSSIEDESIRDTIDKHGIITGGSIASMLLNEKTNDYDYYFDDFDAAMNVAQYYVNQFKRLNPDHPMVKCREEDFKVFSDIHFSGEKIIKIHIPSEGIIAEDRSSFSFVDVDNDLLENIDFEWLGLENEPQNFADKPKYRPICLTSNAITLSDGVQLIIRFYGNPEEIHKNYDFEHCKCYWIPRTGELVLPQSSLLCILNKDLVYTGSKYPLCSILRTKKFINRGWTINAGQYVKMCLQLNELDLTNPDVLEDQLIGVDVSYFTEIIIQIKNKLSEDPTFRVSTPYLIEIVNRVFD